MQFTEFVQSVYFRIDAHIFRKALEPFARREAKSHAAQSFGAPINKWINERLKERICLALLEKYKINMEYFKRKNIWQQS